MKKAGNAIMTVVGGREVHPINLRVGGFYRAPSRAELRALVDPLERARETALETVRWTAQLPFPDVERDPELVALREPGALSRSISGGSSRAAGSTSAPAEFDEHFVEEHVEHSNALHARIRTRGAYLTRAARALQPVLDAAAPARARRGSRGGPRRRAAGTRS